MKLLALETSDTNLGACLWEDVRVKALKTEPQGGASHSQKFMPLLDGLFRKAGWRPEELDAVAVDVGPGRFTGLRLGVSAARTLGQALQKPVVEVSSLETAAAQGAGWDIGRAFQWRFPADLLCVLLDARKDDVYMAVWRFHKAMDRTRRAPSDMKILHTFGHHFKLVHAPTLFAFDRFLAFFKSCFHEQVICFAGNAARTQKTALTKAFGRRALFAPHSDVLDPRYVAALGAEKFYRRDVKSFNQVLPLYLRPSYAEENLAKAVLS